MAISYLNFIEVMMSSFIVTLMGVALGTILGGFVTRYYAKHYYEKASRELREEALELRKYNKLILRALEQAELVELSRDENGEITGLVLKMSLTESITIKSQASAELTVNDDKQS